MSNVPVDPTPPPPSRSRTAVFTAAMAGVVLVSIAIAGIYVWFGWTPGSDSPAARQTFDMFQACLSGGALNRDGTAHVDFPEPGGWSEVQVAEFIRCSPSALGPRNCTDLDPDEMVMCLEPFDLIIGIWGLPGISAVYDSRDVSMDLHGFGGGMENWAPGRCFVADNELGALERNPFQTNVVISRPGAIVSQLLTVGAVSLTVDVGVSIGAGDPDGPQPFVGLVVQLAGASENVDYENFGIVEYSYVAALPDRNAEIKVDAKQIPTPANPFAGYATFTSSFYDETKFQNFINEGGMDLPVWEGNPLYFGGVSVMCGGGV